ncbi:MAG: GNAT family N-acetyltransferase [Sandaracinaceae bacterium]
MPDPHPPYRIGPETERLLLRAARVDDAEAMYALNTDPDVMRYTHEPMPASLGEMRARIASYPDFERHGFGRWLCVDKVSGRVIGFAGLKHLSDLGEVDLGYRLLPAYWGRGLATEAARACVEFGFRTLGLESIIGLVLPDNAASRRVLEKVGMRLEGRLRYDGVPCLRYRRARDTGRSGRCRAAGERGR